MLCAVLACATAAAGCFAPDQLPAAALAPPKFMRERRLQDEALAAGDARAVRQRARDLLHVERTPEHLVLAARVEEDPQQALGLLDEALAKDPDFAWARYGMAFIVIEKEILDRYEESAEHLRWLLDRGFVHRRNPELMTRRLLIEDLDRLGQAEQEAEEWEALLEEAPWDDDAIYNLAWVLVVKLREPEDALPHLDRLLARDPDAIDPRMLKARALWDCGECSAAARLYEELSHLHPDALLNLALLYDGPLADRGRAVEYYRRYLDYDGFNADERRWYDKNFYVPNRLKALE